MCETAPKKTYGWKGWSDLPAPHITSATGPWIDLSHRITETLSRIPFFPQPVIRQIATKPARLTEIHWVVHHGTHLDAPCHFISDGPAIDEVPLERFYGPGVI
jgi:kynurenine formamidase